MLSSGARLASIIIYRRLLHPRRPFVPQKGGRSRATTPWDKRSARAMPRSAPRTHGTDPMHSLSAYPAFASHWQNAPWYHIRPENTGVWQRHPRMAIGTKDSEFTGPGRAVGSQPAICPNIDGVVRAVCPCRVVSVCPLPPPQLQPITLCRCALGHRCACFE